MEFIGANTLRPGMIYKLDGKYFLVLEYQHVNIARTAPFVKVKHRDLIAKQVQERTFKSGDKVEQVEVKVFVYIFLYIDKDLIYIMDKGTYETICIDIDLLDIKKRDFLIESTEISILKDQDILLYITIPQYVNLRIDQTTNAEKGGADKVAILETGIRIVVPNFLSVGDIIKVNTENGQYVERVK